MKLKPYPEYQDSGVPWLGKIPVHWELHRGKNLFKKMERPVRPSDEVVTCFRDGVVTLRKNRRTQGFTESLKEIGYQGIRKGDLIIHQMDAFAGAVGVSDSDGKGTPVYSVCLPKKDLNTYYYAFLVREMSRIEYITSLAKGIRERSTDFRFDAFSSLILPVPSSMEQINITRFLRLKTAQINKFIKNKHAFIFLLKEQKQNIINRAVTRGLDPNVKLKPSGVEWIGDIPEHWDVIKFKNSGTFLSGGTPSKSIAAYWKGNIPWVSPKDMKSKYIFETIEHINEDAVLQSATALVEAGTLLMVVRSGILRRMIPVGIAKKKVAFNQDIKAIKVKTHSFESEFLFLLIEGCQKKLLEKWKKVGATVESIEHQFMANTYLPHPPLDEQKGIVEALKKATELIDQTLLHTEREIELMTEYRNRLISDVVTGKVDVRDIDVPEISEEELLVPEEEAEGEEGLSEEEVLGDEDREADE